MKYLGAEILKIDPMFLFFLVKKCDSTYRKTHQITDQTFSESIRKFLDIHLQRVKKNLENTVKKVPPFFHNLKIEEEKDEELDSLDLSTRSNKAYDENPINDSPFEVKKGRSIEDVYNFITILD